MDDVCDPFRSGNCRHAPNLAEKAYYDSHLVPRTPSMSTEERAFPLDRVALALLLMGLVLGVIIAMVGDQIERESAMHGCGVFVAFSVAAIVLGFLTRASAVEKTTWITSSLRLGGSLAILG